MTDETTRKVPRTEQVIFRLTPEGIEALDEMRGSWNRAQYMRHLLKVALTQKIRGPEKPADFD